VVMEVSAHAIALKKVEALDFYIKALTNITQDHLDFFESLKQYQKTKMEFIKNGKCVKVVNIDDRSGYELSTKDAKLSTFSTKQNADLMAKNIDKTCSNYDLVENGNTYRVSTNLMGLFNVENALCASLICNKLGISYEDISKSLKTFKSVAGRLNVYKKGNKSIVVDFAHTPDALEKILKTLKPCCKRLFCVFGCGGNRDSNKRPQMGEIATRICDYVVVSSDNPRFEEPAQIAKEIASGIKTKNYEIILDRTQAIKSIINKMADGDLLAICGKGDENYLDIKGKKYDYSDRAVVEECGFVEI